MRTLLDTILSKVPGNISRDVCNELTRRVASVPDDGLILDLCPGAGRSTVILAAALEAEENGSAKVLSVDTHVTNPLSTAFQEDGTLFAFFRHLRFFHLLHRVTPIIDSIGIVTQIFNKRSANLVIVQVPNTALNIEDSLTQAIEVAQFAVRKNGKIVVVCPCGIAYENFVRFVASRFTEGFELLEGCNEVQTYEYVESHPIPRAPRKNAGNSNQSEVE